VRSEPKGVLLDIDGTLLDSNDAHADAYIDAFACEHMDIPFARVRPLIGMGADEVMKTLGVDPASDLAARIQARKKTFFASRYLPQVRPLNGARALLRFLKYRGLDRTTATSADAGELRALLAAAHIDDLIDAKSTSSDVSASKPNPDVVEVAIQKSHHPPAELVMLGDTPYDLEAGKRAGVPVIALRTGGWPDARLAGALRIVDDPADLLQQWTSLWR
jgi:HAD superfamily hydrolase (TIGR01509 family)